MVLIANDLFGCGTVSSFFRRVFKLPMIALGSYMNPSVILQCPNNVSRREVPVHHFLNFTHKKCVKQGRVKAFINQNEDAKVTPTNWVSWAKERCSDFVTE
jgi:hypothetical protein